MSRTQFHEIFRRWPEGDEEMLLLEQLADESNVRGSGVRELLARRDLWSVPLGELLVGLDSMPGYGPVGLTTRCRHAMGRNGLSSWTELSGVDLDHLAELRNFGPGSLYDLLDALLELWAKAHSGGLLRRSLNFADPAGQGEPGRPSPPLRGDVPAEPVPDPFDGIADGIVGALRWLWESHGVRTLGDALRVWPTVDPSPQMKGAIDQALDACLSDLLDLPVASEAMWRTLLDFDERSECILRLRSLADPQLTLQELGTRLGVTRERVRQLESKALKQLSERWNSEACAGLRHLCAATWRTIGPLATIETVDEVVNQAVQSSSEPAAGDSLREGVLRLFGGPRVVIDRISLTQTAARRLQSARTFADNAELGTPIPRDWLLELIDELGADDEGTKWIEAHLRLRLVDAAYMPWRGSLADKAFSMLAARGETLTMVELHEAVGWDAHPRSLSGQVQGDARIMRRGRDRYGLRSWGGEEYSGICEELEQAIERSDTGRIDLGQIIPFFVEEFGVSESSVRAYAADRRFVRHADGSLSLRSADDPEARYTYQRPEETKGLFLLDGAWHLRVVVDGELLRGSGRPMRNGVALAAGLEPGLAIGFEYEGGSVLFSWRGKQPTIGSMRGIATHHVCVEEDLLFIPLEGAEPRPSRVVRSSQLARRQGLSRMLLEVGYADGDNEDDPRDVARALALPSGALWSDIADRLRDRGDGQLVDLMPEEWL